MSLYPKLDINNSNNFRLNKIDCIQKSLDDESEARRVLHNKYKKGINALIIMGYILTASSVLVGILNTIFVAYNFMHSLIIPLEIMQTVFSSVSIIFNVTTARLTVKATKHDEIRILAISKSNTISSLVSQALQDNDVSDYEFNLILAEVEKYHKLKSDLRTVPRKVQSLTHSEELQLLERGREEGKELMMKRLTDMNPLTPSAPTIHVTTHHA